jgi:hypothetical protein
MYLHRCWTRNHLIFALAMVGIPAPAAPEASSMTTKRQERERASAHSSSRAVSRAVREAGGVARARGGDREAAISTAQAATRGGGGSGGGVEVDSGCYLSW